MSLALLPLQIILVALDALITLLTFGWIGAIKHLLAKEPMRSVPVGDDPSHRVDPAFKDELATTPSSGCETLYAIAERSFRIYGDKNCMSTREYLGMHSVKPPIKKFGKTFHKTFDTAKNESMKFGAALRKAGLTSAPEVATLDAIDTPCSIAIFENTCSEWLIAALGAFSQSMIVTTIYATLGMDAVCNAICDVSIRAIVCNKKNVNTVVGRLNDMPSLKTIIYTNDQVAPGEEVKLSTAPAGVQIVSMEDFIASGDEIAFPVVPPKPSSMAVLMYTSGSTGTPKGVVISHAQIVAAIGALENYWGFKQGEDMALGYLPLAHIMELMVEFTLIASGVTICYADPKVLSTKGAYPTGALEEFSPTVLAAVPKIWDVIKKGVEAKVNASSPIAKCLVKTAFAAKKFAINHGYDTPLFNVLVFKKLKKAVGGNMKAGLSGGGPLNSEVQEFIRVCFGIKFVQGYGLTETCAGLTLQAMDDLRPGVVGFPIPSVEVRLSSCPEITDRNKAPYLSTDTTDVNGEPVFGRGEVQIKGNSLSLGYYKMQDKTDEVYGKDGFFSTGDVGQFLSDGSLRIVDRVKNLVKLKSGEYIAVENMEMVYGNSSFVDAVAGGICCYGDGDMDRPVAMMQLNEPVAMKWAKDNGIKGTYEEIRSSAKLNEAVLKDMHNEAKKGKLSHIEKLKAVTFVGEAWTPENGCLTAANKLERRSVRASFSKEFDELREKGIFH